MKSEQPTLKCDVMTPIPPACLNHTPFCETSTNSQNSYHNMWSSKSLTL